MERLCITVLSLTQIRLQTAAVVFGNMGWASNIPEWSVFTYINVRRCWLHSSNKLPAQHRMRKWSEATVWLLLPCKTALCPDTSVQALTCFCWSAHGMYVYIFKHSLGWPALYLSETTSLKLLPSWDEKQEMKASTMMNCFCCDDDDVCSPLSQWDFDWGNRVS